LKNIATDATFGGLVRVKRLERLDLKRLNWEQAQLMHHEKYESIKQLKYPLSLSLAK